MTDRYRIDAGNSRVTVQAFAAGMLSFMGHSPTFAVRGCAGQLRWPPGSATAGGLEITVRADTLELVDQVRPADREEIERRMRQEVLETTAFPDIRFTANEVTSSALAGDRYRLRINGLLALHGVSGRLTLDTELTRYDDGVRFGGTFPLRLSEYQIRPVTALGGAIHLQDQLKVVFDIAAWKEVGG